MIKIKTASGLALASAAACVWLGAGACAAQSAPAPQPQPQPLSPLVINEVKAAISDANAAAEAARGAAQRADGAAQFAGQQANEARTQAQEASRQAGFARRAVEVATHQDMAAAENVAVGAGGLLDRQKDRQPLARTLDGCLKQDATGYWREVLNCSLLETLAAGRAYRRRAGLQQEASDAFALSSTIGTTGAVLESFVNNANFPAVSWFAMGTINALAEDLSGAGARGRLYGFSASALSHIAWRYQLLGLAQEVAADEVWELHDDVGEICGPAGALHDLRVRTTSDAAKREGRAAAFSDQLSRLTVRCGELTAATGQLLAAPALADRQSYLAVSLRRDVVTFDDLVTKIDRSLRVTPAEGFNLVLSAPFAMATNFLSGGTRAANYTSRGLDEFLSPISFHLTELPLGDLPAPLPADLGRTPVIDEFIGSSSGQVRDQARRDREEALSIAGRLNAWSVRLNRLIGLGREMQRLNRLSVVKIDYNARGVAVTLETPTATP
ncbi:hypothetical protein [Caulobacter mirabilis]|uniref:Uncharacterized protein n=1 Tax=Caulobacter mirabilis TaxID=69666 RepID=A0A2D2B2N0_9CAUL|nr:hypothetical protein [Caulobacter mirabilis]ATQ44487.1 hypothetical protein CSW64_19900 [Caulobacter mirabilis]